MFHPTLLRLSSCCLALALGAPVAGCTSERSPTRNHSGVSVHNRLVYNRLVYNRLVYNRLVYNRLVYNRLDATHLQIEKDTGIETTEEGRDVLTYIARCALADSDILVATHHGVDYEFPGLLALAPEWEHQALPESKQRLISACLLAHVNAFGESVQISMRADGQIDSSQQERREFPVYEATFFGQVFGEDDIAAYACQGDNPLIALAHSASRSLRVCADPDNPCGFVSVGRCRDVCDEQVAMNGWRGCRAGDQRFDETISTYLFADDADGQNRVCDPASKHCAMTSVPATSAILYCADGDECTATCGADGTCTIDGATREQVHARVKPGAIAETACLGTDECELDCDDASCELSCRGAERCEASCERGADCELDCRRSARCEEVKCQSGASCLLLCDPGADCWFRRCWHPDGVLQCGDGALVCGRPCP